MVEKMVKEHYEKSVDMEMTYCETYSLSSI